MMTPRQLYINERAVTYARTLYECRKCGKVTPEGGMPCDCEPRRYRVVDPLKLWRKACREMKKHGGVK